MQGDWVRQPWESRLSMFTKEYKYTHSIPSLSASETHHWRDLFENDSLIIHSFNKYTLTIYHVDTTSDLTKLTV